MEMNLTKGEKTIAIVALTATSIFIAMFIQLSRGSKAEPLFENASAIDYTMARPDQAYSEYTLEGRELDHSYEALPQEAPTKDKHDKLKKELIAKKVAETKKKEESKKKQAEQAKVQEQNKAKASEATRAQAIADKTKSNSDLLNQSNNNNAGGVQNNAVPTQNATDLKNSKPKKSYAQWRNTLFANPTSENLALFIAAFRKNEVTSTEFQAMAQDLLDQNDLKFKALGLMTLRSVPSLGSLSQLVHLDAASMGNYQSYVDQSIMAYMQTPNLQYLGQALLTQDKTLVAKSLILLNTNLLKFSQGDFAGLIDPRNRREGEVVNFSMNNYKSLLPVLTQLGASPEQEFSAQAQQIIALIQSTNNVAQN